jgi:hypothetical protein
MLSKSDFVKRKMAEENGNVNGRTRSALPQIKCYPRSDEKGASLLKSGRAGPKEEEVKYDGSNCKVAIPP